MRKFYQLLILLTYGNSLYTTFVKCNRFNLPNGNKFFGRVCWVLLLCFFNFVANAGTFYSKISGNANVLTTWGTAPDGTGTAPANFITSGDIFVLRSASVLALNGNFTIGVGVTLQIDGNLNVSGPNDDVTINGTVVFTRTGSAQVSLTGGGGGNDFILSPGATLKTANVNGIRGSNCSLPTTASGLILLNTTANYEFNGSSTQASLGLPASVNNLTINNTTSVSIASVTINGTLTVNAGVNFTPSGTITMGASASTIINNGTLTFSGLTIFATPTAQSQYDASYNVAGLMTVSSGVTFAPSGGAITRPGTAWTTTLTGAFVTFFNYTIAGTPTTQPASSFSMAGVLTVNSATTLAPAAGNITMAGANSGISNGGTLTFNNLTIAASPTTQTQYNSSYSVAGALTVNSLITFAPTGGTITRTGTAWSTTLTGAMVTFYNYTIAGTPATLPSASYSIAGLLTVNTGVTLAPVGGTITMSTTTSAISNNGTLSFNNLTANNTGGLSVGGNVTVNGTLDFLAGLITPSTSLTIGSAGTITNSSPSKYVNGKLNIIFSGIGTKIFPVGKGGNYRPVTFQYVTLAGTPSTVSFEQFETQMSGTLPASTNIDANRYWDFSQSGGTSYTYKITLDPTGFTPTGIVVQLTKDAGIISSNSTTSPNYSNAADYPLMASPTSIALGSNCSATSANAGSDQTGAATCGFTTVTLSGNTPANGTGGWTIISGAGGSFGNAFNPSSSFNGVAGTGYLLRWTITNGNCSAQDDVAITFNQNPSTANAGVDQTSSATCGLIIVSLSANAPSSGTGSWSIVSGTGGSFSNMASENSTFSGNAGSAYVLRWTITNGSCTLSDDVNIAFNSGPTSVNAGPDQSGSPTCGLTVTLAANVPSNGTGAWTVVTGTGGSFSDAANPGAIFSGTAGTIYTLRWTVTNACSSLSDDVDITFATAPTTANAGPDLTGATTCGINSVNLSGNLPTTGTGSWSIVSGAGGTVTTAGSPTSTFTGSAGTTFILRWTISNSPCAASTDDVIITFNQNPSPANAGVDQTSAATCGLTSVTLAANAATAGTGAWTIISGTGGTVTTPSGATSAFNGINGSTYTLRWTISNSPCTSSSDDVVITFNRNPTTANAGADQTGAATCGITTVTLAGNTPATGSGAWSIVSGIGGTITTVSSATSTFSGTAGNTYTLRWTIANSPCALSADDVVVTFNQNPSAPTAQGTALLLTPSTSTIGGTFTAASPAASGYLVVRTLTSAQPSGPANGTTYTVGSFVLGGTIISAGTGTTFASSSLLPATQYWFWVYSYNSNLCAGTPSYYTLLPLTGSTTTTSCGSLTTRTWIGVGNGGLGTDFNTATNWTPSGVPSVCDSVRIVVDGNNGSNVIAMSASATIGALFYFVTNNKNVSRLDIMANTLTVLRTTTLDADGQAGSQCQISVGTGAGSAGTALFKGLVTVSNPSGSANSADVFFRGITGSFSKFIFENDLFLASEHAVTSGSNFPEKYIFQGASQSITFNGLYFKMSNIEVGDGVNPTTLTFNGSQSADVNGDAALGASVTIKENSTLDLGTLTLNRYKTGGALGDAVNLLNGATLKLAGATGGQTGSNFPRSFASYNLTPGTVEYNSLNGVNQTVYAPVTYGNLVITNKTGSGTSTKNLTANITGIAGNVTINSFNIFDLQTFTANRSSAGGSLSLAANATMKLSAGSGGQTGSNFPGNFSTTLNAISTVEYYGVVAQIVHPTPVYGHLTISNNSTKTAGNALTMAGNVLIQTSGIFAGSTFNHLVAGNWTNNSSATAFTSSGLVTFNGTVLQTIGGTFSSNFNNLTINNSSNVNLAQAEFVNALLTLSAGNLNIAGFNLTINGSSAVDGAPFSSSKMIIADGGGEVRKSFTANGSYFFPIGDNTGGADYSPVTLGVTGVSYAGAWIGASVIDAKHPNNQSTTHFLTRYWRVNQLGVGTCAASVLGTYLNSAADISGTEANTSSAQLRGVFNQLTNPWLKFSALGANTLVANSAVITAGQTSAFTGITSASPTVNVSGGGGTICNGASVALNSTVTGDPVFAYAWTPATGLSSSTVANPAATPSTTTTYSLTAYDGNGITASASAAAITVRPRPTGIISGTASICPTQNTNLTITLTGTGPWNGTLSNGAAFSGATSPITLSVSPASNITFTIATLTDAYCTATNIDLSGMATITVNSPPAISSEPASATRCVGQSHTFSVTATGTAITYQWRKGGVNIPGATSSTYNISIVNTGDAGLYDVVVTGVCTPSATSSAVTLGINTLPAITGQPVSATLCVGQSQTFFVVATGTALTYQWRKGGVNISGATLASLNITSLATADAGNYDVVVSGACTPPITSVSVSLAVNAAPIITGNPVSRSVCAGTAVNFSVVVSAGSNTGITYQWKKNGTNITGATASTYSLTSPVLVDAGNYTVSVTSCGTTATSTNTTLSVSAAETWLGINNNWNDGQNWCGGLIPTVLSDVIIPTMGSSNYPYVVATAYCRNIRIVAGASITIINATMQIAGIISNSGTFNATFGTVEMIGNIAQTIPANTFQNNLLKSLIISNTGAGVSLGGPVDITESLTYTGAGKNLVTNDFLTLKSTASNTARVGDMTGNSLTGKVTVERYLPARRAWRFLSVPTSGTQTIKEAWQEGATSAGSNPVPGFGIHIGSNKGSWSFDGFDLYTAGGPTLKTYNSVSNSWQDIGATTKSFGSSPIGYMVFVRGDRPATGISVPTVLRTKGNLFIGDQPALAVNPSTFTAIGNPFASAIDMRTINKTGVKEFFYAWDPNISGAYGLGAYQTFSLVGSDYVVTPGMGSYGASGSVNNFIQSGQAFFVEGTTVGGTINFKEAAKTSGSALVSLWEQEPGRQFRTNLYGVNVDSSTYMADGIFINFDERNTNAVNDMDAIKMPNGNENLSIKTAGKYLAVERKQNILQADTIFFAQSRMRAQSYRFEFIAEKLNEPGMVAFLEDTYLNTTAPLNLYGTTIVNFSVVNVPGSYAENRFRIVFTPAVVLPLTITSIKAYSKNMAVQVEWVVENESSIRDYDVERSGDGVNFFKVNTTPAKNTHLSSYYWLDANCFSGYNYYRIKSTDLAGKKECSKTVKVFMGSLNQRITVYPNPVEDGIINIQMINQGPGTYTMRLLDASGQQVLLKQVDHATGNSAETIRINRTVAKGLYKLQIAKPNGKEQTISLIF